MGHDLQKVIEEDRPTAVDHVLPENGLLHETRNTADAGNTFEPEHNVATMSQPREVAQYRVAIAGPMGVGKTTAARRLVEAHGFEVLGFATPLYELQAIHEGPVTQWRVKLLEWCYRYLSPADYPMSFVRAFIEGAEEAFLDTDRTGDVKNRALLQRLGTEVGRALDPELWVKIWEGAVRYRPGDARIVNDNLRFPNELEACKRRGFVTLYLDAAPETLAERYRALYGSENAVERAHASETALAGIKDGCGMVILNDGITLGRFLELIDGIATGWEEVSAWNRKASTMGPAVAFPPPVEYSERREMDE